MGSNEPLSTPLPEYTKTQELRTIIHDGPKKYGDHVHDLERENRGALVEEEEEEVILTVVSSQLVFHSRFSTADFQESTAQPNTPSLE